MVRLKALSEWLYEKSRLSVFLVALLIFLLFLGIILPREATRLESIAGITDSPDTSLFYTPSYLYDLAQEYGEEGRAYYIRSRFTFDLIWPLAYLFFLVTSLSFTFHSVHAKSFWRILNILPFGGLIFDYLENIMVSLVMYRYPLSSSLPAFFAPLFTLVKWIFIGGSFLFLLVGWGLLFSRWLRREK